MKKVLAQWYAINTNVQGVGSGSTVNNYTDIYPAGILPANIKYIKIDSIYINSNAIIQGDKAQYNFNIRIVKSPDSVNPMSGPNKEYNRNKNVIISKPHIDKTTFPIVLKNIAMQPLDKIVVQSNIPGLSVVVFGEEFKYDTDDMYQMINNNLANMNNVLVDINNTLDNTLSNINDTLVLIKNKL